MMSDFVEQYTRVLRHYIQLKSVYNPELKAWSTAERTDCVVNFFINCFHLKDWILNDKKFKKKFNVDVEKYIKNKYFNICRYFCHGSKHLTLIRRYRSNTTKINSISTQVKIQSDKITSGSQYTVNYRGKRYDVLEVGTICINRWRDYLRDTRNLGLIYQEKAGLNLVDIIELENEIL